MRDRKQTGKHCGVLTRNARGEGGVHQLPLVALSFEDTGIVLCTLDNKLVLLFCIFTFFFQSSILFTATRVQPL